jgi:hypothetical protein
MSSVHDKPDPHRAQYDRLSNFFTLFVGYSDSRFVSSIEPATYDLRIFIAHAAGNDFVRTPRSLL